MSIDVMRARDFTGDARSEISRVFVEGFGHWLTFFSKDEDKLMRAFAHTFDLDQFYVAVDNGNIAGITACADGKKPSLKISAGEFRKHLGLVMGTIAAIILKKEFEKPKYPFQLTENAALIEDVSTGREYRGKGVASSIIKYIFSDTDFSEYILEVADTNTAAVSLYSKLGFQEFTRVRMKNPKQSGIDFLIYMKFLKS